MKEAFLTIKYYKMAVWAWETETDFTDFFFPLEEHRIFFEDLVKSNFENSRAISERWTLLVMLRREPMKHPDFFEIANTNVFAISQKAADSLELSLRNEIELLPIETDAGRYYALNVLKFVDCLDRKNSVYTSTNNGLIVAYSTLEFIEEKINGNIIFKIPELPYQIFVTDEISEICEEVDLRGLTFNVDSNLVWYN